MKLFIGIAIGLVIAGGLVGVVTLKPAQNTQPTPTTEQSAKSPSAQTASPTTTSAGRYVDYAADSINDTSYTETILFFHAPWCPECRAFEQSIRKSSIPAGVQILKVDYDSSSALKSQYGVTLQTTFVKVSPSGEKISSWVGYGKNKSVDAILENT